MKVFKPLLSLSRYSNGLNSKLFSPLSAFSTFGQYCINITQKLRRHPAGKEFEMRSLEYRDRFLQLFIRFRYPVSLPEEVAKDLGLNISNYLTFPEFITCLTDPSHRPTKLARFMPRDQAEDTFRFALRKERFQQNSLFSYHFKGGWVEFVLQFDEQSRLRRLYIRHKDLKQKHEISIS